jgi:hypothetical protein
VYRQGAVKQSPGAFQWKIEYSGYTYVFILPFECFNLSWAYGDERIVVVTKPSPTPKPTSTLVPLRVIAEVPAEKCSLENRVLQVLGIDWRKLPEEEQAKVLQAVVDDYSRATEHGHRYQPFDPSHADVPRFIGRDMRAQGADWIADDDNRELSLGRIDRAHPEVDSGDLGVLHIVNGNGELTLGGNPATYDFGFRVSDDPQTLYPTKNGDGYRRLRFDRTEWGASCHERTYYVIHAPQDLRKEIKRFQELGHVINVPVALFDPAQDWTTGR